MAGLGFAVQIYESVDLGIDGEDGSRPTTHPSLRCLREGSGGEANRGGPHRKALGTGRMATRQSYSGATLVGNQGLTSCIGQAGFPPSPA
jgi:hypothetical protein